MGGPLLISIHCDPGVVKGSFPVLQRINEKSFKYTVEMAYISLVCNYHDCIVFCAATKC